MSALETQLLENRGSSRGHGHSHGHGHGHGHSQDHDGHTSTPTGRENVTRQKSGLIDSVQWLNAHDPTDCANHIHVEVDCEQARCDHKELNVTANTVVIVRANELITMSRVNTFLAVTALLYISVNLVCCVLNSYDNDCDPHKLGCNPATTPQLFHNLEFWATFVFNTVDLLAISYSPRTLSNQYQNPVLLKLLVLFNVCLSFCGSLLVSINLEKFEVASHELEYCNELIITIFDALILATLLRGNSHQTMTLGRERLLALVSLGSAFIVAGGQLAVYNLSGWTLSGDSKGETLAHYLEFTFGILSGFITFWFTMDNKFSAEKRLRQIMYGDVLQNQESR